MAKFHDCNESLLIAPEGLIGDRVMGKPGIWRPGNLLHDIAAEHSKIIDGAIIEALTEIEGKMPHHFDLADDLGKLLHDECSSVFLTVTWKGEPILEVYRPEPAYHLGRTVISRKIKRVWRQRLNVMRAMQ